MEAAPKTVKVVLLGDAGSGKTALVNRWINASNPTNTKPTVGACFKQQFVDIEGNEFNVNIWDTAGSEKYGSTIPLYCRNASAGLIVFDLTNEESFESVARWVDVLHEGAPNTPYIICGNKCDLYQKFAVESEKIHSFAKSRGVEYFETSALTGSSVDDAFNSLSILATNATKHNQAEEEIQQVANIEPAQAEGPKKSCC